MERYVFRLVPYYLGWILSRVFLGWLGLTSLLLAIMILFGYVVEFSFLGLLQSGMTETLESFRVWISDLLILVRFDSFKSFFGLMLSPLALLVGFLFSFVMGWVVQVMAKKFYLFLLLIILAAGSLTLIQFSTLPKLPIDYELMTRFLGGALCILGFYVVEIVWHSLKWCLFMLHILFLQPELVKPKVSTLDADTAKKMKAKTVAKKKTTKASTKKKTMAKASKTTKKKAVTKKKTTKK